MNTKTTKFLAVLAVLVMAFAAIAITAPAESDDAASTDALTTLTSSTTTGGSYYATGTVEFTEATFSATTLYLNYGASITLKITAGADANLIIYPISAYNSSTKIATYEAAESLTWAVTAASDANKNITINRATAANGGYVTYSTTAALATPAPTPGASMNIATLNGAAAYYTATDLKAGATVEFVKVNDTITLKANTYTGTLMIGDSTNYVEMTGVTVATNPMVITSTTLNSLVTIGGSGGASALSGTSFTVHGRVNQDATNVANPNGITSVNLIGTDLSTASSIYYGVGGTWEPTATVIAFGNVGNVTLPVSTQITLHDGKVATGTFTFGTTSQYKVEVTSATGSLNTGATAGQIALTAGSATVLKGNVSIAANGITAADITVNEGTILSLGGAWAIQANHYLYLYGTLNSTVSGTLRTVSSGGDSAYIGIGPNAVISSDITYTETNLNKYAITDDYEELSGSLYENRSVPNGILKTGSDYTIESGATLKVNGILNLNKQTIYVYGTLELAGTSVVEGYMDDGVASGSIVLCKGGEIISNGILGKNIPVTVSYMTKVGGTAEGTVKLSAVKGLTFSSGVDYNLSTSTETHLTIQGTVTKTASTLITAPTIQVTDSVIIPADLTISNGVTLDVDSMSYVQSGATVTGANGSILRLGANTSLDDTNYFLTIENGAYFTTAGIFTGGVAVQTFIKTAATSISAPTYGVSVFFSGDDDGDAAAANNATRTVSGFTVTADRVQYTSASKVYYDQRAYIAGDLKVVDTATGIETRTLYVTGLAFIPEEAELNLSTTTNALTFVAGPADARMVVQGDMGAYNPATNNAIKILGVAFNVTVGTETTYYGTNYADGLAALLLADEITIYGAGETSYGNGVGKYTLVEDLVIEKDKTVSGTTAALTVPKSLSITVKSGGSLSASVISSLSGKLIVESGATCTSLSSSLYQVTMTEPDGTVIYAGLEVVLSEAKAGDVITLPGEMSAASTINSLVIPEGVTLNVTGTLYVRQLTVETDAVVKMGSSGSINMTSNADKDIYTFIKVAGKMDVTTGNLNFTSYSAEKSSVTSVGQLIYSGAPFGTATIVGVVYTNTDGYSVLTSLENALEAGAKAITIDGDYESLEDVSLNGATLTITSDSTVTIANLDISKGVLSVTGAGGFTGTITGYSGVEGSEEIVSMDVVKLTGQISDKYEMNSSAKYEYTFTTDEALTGAIDLESGKLVMADNITPGASYYFTVGEDAVLYVNGATLGAAKEAVINGEVEIVKNKTFVVTPDLIIDGEVLVNAGSTLDANGKVTLYGDLYDYGTVTVAGIFTFVGNLLVDDDATFTAETSAIVGTPAVAADPGLVGLLSLAANAYLIDYDGILDKDDFKTGSVDSAMSFIINGEAYFNLFWNGAAKTVATILAAADFSSITSYNISGITTDTKWSYSNGTAVAAGADVADGKDLYFTAKLVQVTIQTSWANGLALYVDGMRMSGNTYTLDVGLHEITATVNAGYKCSDMKITFDGAPVTSAGILIDVDDGNAILAVNGTVVVDPGSDPTPTPEPSKESEWNVTTILLVILVVLIAIMAVIIALRLNRN